MFYEDQNPLQRLAIAGVANDPVHLDPPGCATPSDALNFPERLVKQLNRMDPDTVATWDAPSLKKIPTNVLSQLTPDVLACLPEVVLNRVPYLREKCPIDILQKLMPKSECLANNFTKLAMLKLRDQQADHATLDAMKNKTTSSCIECASIGIKCSRDLPQCCACKKFGEQCTYGDVKCFEQSFSDISAKETKHLGLDLSCPITQKHLHISRLNHLNPLTKDRFPRKYSPKPIFTTEPNIPKIPLRNRTVKRIVLGTIWELLLDLHPLHPLDFPGPVFPTLAKFYPGAPVETLTYPYSYPQEETFHLRPSIRITIPDHLKTLLVDDWENVTKSLLLVPLPSKAPANFIIDSYYDEEKGARRLGSADQDVLEEFCAGMKVYFEKSVGKILLYRFERGQLAEVSFSLLFVQFTSHIFPPTYNTLITSTFPRSATSGNPANTPNGKAKAPATSTAPSTSAACLVFRPCVLSPPSLQSNFHTVNLPELIAQTNMDSQSVNRLREEISKFCTWLARNSGRFFCAKYEKPSAEYIENAR
jgi:hypothetical protein